MIQVMKNDDYCIMCVWVKRQQNEKMLLLFSEYVCNDSLIRIFFNKIHVKKNTNVMRTIDIQGE